MSEIKVTWKRTVQTKPFESIGVELGVTETIDAPPVPMDEKQAAARGAKLAQLEKEIAVKLAEVGDQVVARLLNTPDYPRPKPQEQKPASPNTPSNPGW